MAPHGLKEEAKRRSAARIERLRAVMVERFEGSQARLAATIQVQPDYLWRLLNGRKALGDDLARAFEARLGLDPFSLEGKSEEQVESIDRAQRVARLFARLPASEQERLAPVIEAIIGPFIPSEQVEERMPITKKRPNSF